jgi:hypothetical protein
MSCVIYKGYGDFWGFCFFPVGIIFLEAYISVSRRNESLNSVLMTLLTQVRNGGQPFKMWKMNQVKYVAQAFSDSQAVTLVTLTSGFLSMV